MDGLRADGISFWLRQAESGLARHCSHAKPLSASWMLTSIDKSFPDINSHTIDPAT